MKTTLLSLAAIATLSTTLYGANAYTLENINVTSSQDTTLNKKDVPDSVTIITKEALQESRINTLAEALNKLGNIAMTQNGGPGKTTSMFVRGMNTNQMLVLIDGVRYNNVTGSNGAAQYSQIMLSNVEQIEIIKGAQSGVWGADASGGVINVITSRAKEGLHGVANIEYGSFDTKIASLQASYATEDFDILMGGSYFDMEGFSAAEPTSTSPDFGKRGSDLGWETDAYTNKSFNAKLGWNITEGDRIEASVETINSYVEYDAGAGVDAENVDDPFGYGPSNYFNNLKNRFYSLSYQHTDDVNDAKIVYNKSTFNQDQYGGYTGYVDEAKINDKITYADDSFVLLGGSYQKFKINKDGGTDLNEDFNAKSVFATNYNKFNLFDDLSTIVTESLRYDNYSKFDNATTGKVGVKQYLYKELYLSANAGNGYNVPTLDQLFNAYWGTATLTPQKTVTTDITLGTDTLWVTAFYNTITDEISYDFTTYHFTNIDGKSKIKGAELGYKDYFFDLLGLSANYTYISAKNDQGEELARRPKHQVDASIVYYVTEDLDLGLNGQYVGERFNRANRQGAQTGKYVIANFVANYNFNEYVGIYGKIDNITDEYYQTVDGYATAKRSYYIGLTAKY